jgi:hypothetical protein
MVAAVMGLVESAFFESLESGCRFGFMFVPLAGIWLQSPCRLFHAYFSLKTDFILSVRFANMVLQYIIFLFNTKKFGWFL